MSETYRPRPGDRAWSPCGRFTWRPSSVARAPVQTAVVDRDGVVFTVDRADSQVLNTTTEEAVLTRAHGHGLVPPGCARLPVAADAWGWRALEPGSLGAAGAPPAAAA